jgi:acetylornithine deacetylase
VEHVSWRRQELLEATARSGADAQLKLLFTGAPLEVSADEEIVTIVRGHAGTELTGVPYWADAALLSEAGIPTVLFGPSGAGAHATTEWVDLDSVEQVRKVLDATARAFCGSAA